jgi:hypothetical protein
MTNLALNNLTFGIEIETAKLAPLNIAHTIQSVVGGLIEGIDYPRVKDNSGRVWSIVPDGSIHSPNGQKGEIVSPILTLADMDTVQQIARAVYAAGGRSHTSYGCAIHIHVGAQNLTPQNLANLAKIVNKQEDILFAAVETADDRKNHYTRPSNSNFIAAIERKMPETAEELGHAYFGVQDYSYHVNTKYDNSRYHGLNLHTFFRRGTVEFRYFNGTLHAGKIKSYIQLCLAMVAHAANAKSASAKKRVYNEASGRYDFRVFLTKIGMNGPEFATARELLTRPLKGDRAFKNTRRAA